MLTLRGIVERVSRGLVFRRRLRGEFHDATVFVSPDASLRYWLLSIDRAAPELLAWARELVAPGSCVWDIGANLGIFGVAAAALAGTNGFVLLVEPDPWLGGLVQRTLAEANPAQAPMRYLQRAVADESGRAELLIAGRGRAANHLESVPGSSQAGGTRDRIEVLITTLDDLLLSTRPPDLVKIDVEGSEASVLRGATTLLKRHRPRLLCEVTSEARREVASILTAAGYDMYDAMVPAAARTRLDLPAWNTLAIPTGAPRA
jgi:FkbM family methyltransferase